MFSPVGDTSRRDQVIELISDLHPGDILTYEMLYDIGMDRQTAQSAVNQAKPGIQRKFKRSVVALRNVGYKVLESSQHIDLAKDHQRRGRRQTARSQSAVSNTDYNELSEIERARYDIAIATLGALQAFEKRADLRYASREVLESFMTGQVGTNERTESQVQDVRERLARLEARLGDSA